MTVDLRSMIREVPDFPEPGVGFKDISPLLADPASLEQAIAQLGEWGRAKAPQLVVGAEARGFILGAALAREIGCGFVPARRPGKLPPETVGVTYALELHPSSFWDGARVLIHDDVLATGGTVDAIGGLIEELGGEVVGAAFLIDLTFLGGRERLVRYDVHSLIEY